MTKTKLEACPCQSTYPLQKHHIFPKKVRKYFMKYGQRYIKIFWWEEEKEQLIKKSMRIPINARVMICSKCHKMIHPENIGFHLNQMVVENLKE